MRFSLSLCFCLSPPTSLKPSSSSLSSSSYFVPMAPRTISGSGFARVLGSGNKSHLQLVSPSTPTHMCVCTPPPHRHTYTLGGGTFRSLRALEDITFIYEALVRRAWDLKVGMSPWKAESIKPFVPYKGTRSSGCSFASLSVIWQNDPRNLQIRTE